MRRDLRTTQAFRRRDDGIRPTRAGPGVKDWPDNIPLLYHSYYIMVGLGAICMGILGLAALLLASPFPIIANTAGWLTAELARQSRLACGLLRTEESISPLVSRKAVS
jgi:cytochrome bd ubiquinol oxidase subunit I